MLKSLFIGLLLFASIPLCLASGHLAKNITFSFTSGKAKGKIIPDNSDFNTQNTSGLMFDIALSDEPLRLALDYFFGEAKVMGTNLQGEAMEAVLRVTETSLGTRYYFVNRSSAIDFYLGGGLALVSANYKLTSPTRRDFLQSASGSESGTYFGFGTRVVLDDGLTLGFDCRTSDAKFEATGSAGILRRENFGFTRANFTLGYSW